MDTIPKLLHKLDRTLHLDDCSLRGHRWGGTNLYQHFTERCCIACGEWDCSAPPMLRFRNAVAKTRGMELISYTALQKRLDAAMEGERDLTPFQMGIQDGDHR